MISLIPSLIFSALFTSFLPSVLAEDCSLLTPLPPNNALFSRACSTEDALGRMCFQHRAGSLRAVHVSNHTDVHRSFASSGIVVENGFLEAFALEQDDITYTIEYLDTGIVVTLVSIPNSGCRTIKVVKKESNGWDFKSYEADTDNLLVDTSKADKAEAKACIKWVDFWLQKSDPTNTISAEVAAKANN